MLWRLLATLVPSLPEVMAEKSSSPAEFTVFDRDLDAACTERYLQSPRLAVDTEAMGLIHGRDRLCLVQIADAEDRVACVRIGLGQTEASNLCLLYTSPSPRDRTRSRMPSSA